MLEVTIHNRDIRKNSSNWLIELASCKPFCTVCLSFLPLHELRYKHLQTLVSVPSAGAMLLAMLHAISRDTARLTMQQCLSCVLYLEMRFLLQGLVLCKALKCMLKCLSASSQECWFAFDSWWYGKKQRSSKVILHFTFHKNPRTQKRLRGETGLFTIHVTDAELLPCTLLNSRKLTMWPGDTGL